MKRERTLKLIIQKHAKNTEEIFECFYDRFGNIFIKTLQVADSMPVIKNEKLRKKEEKKQKEKQAELKKRYSREWMSFEEPEPEPTVSFYGGVCL